MVFCNQFFKLWNEIKDDSITSRMNAVKCISIYFCSLSLSTCSSKVNFLCGCIILNHYYYYYYNIFIIVVTNIAAASAATAVVKKNNYRYIVILLTSHNTHHFCV